MNAITPGKLILKTVPSPRVEKKIIPFLQHYFTKTSRKTIAATVKETPVILSKTLTEQTAHAIIAGLEELGATAAYEPETLHTTAPASDPRSEHKITAEISARVADQTISPPKTSALKKLGLKKTILHKIEEVNKELWLILSMFMIIGLMNYLVTSQRMLLGLYTLPTLLSAYFYGRRHATLTALASIILVGIVSYLNPSLLTADAYTGLLGGRWSELFSWGCILIISAYAMGTLHDRNKTKMQELRQTYQGLIVILRHFISKDKYTENHCYRVSIYAAKIAAYLGLSADQVEDIKSAGLLHDLGKLDISRELLYKASRLTSEEHDGIKKHVDKGVQMMESISSPLGRVLPIVLAHHEKFDGSGYYETSGNDIPFEARVISVADVYDALASDRPYRKAMSPFEAKEIIAKGSGNDFDPVVVNAFIKAFNNGDMDVPNLVV